MQSRIASSLIQPRFNSAVAKYPHKLSAVRNRIFSGRQQPPLYEASCDGKKEGGRKEDDDKEYFSHHKPSALSEIEMADTRKPITKATDGTAADSEAVGYFGGGDVVVWLPEQMETAEETMMRAAEIWEWNKMRGDPNAPQSRVLRALRGEHNIPS